MTNDLISRKDLLEVVIKHNIKEVKYGDWMYTCKVINDITYAPAIQQCGEGEPVAWIDQYWESYTGDNFVVDCISNYMFGQWNIPLYLAPPDQTARINELQKQNEKLSEALENVYSEMKHNPVGTLTRLTMDSIKKALREDK